MLPSQRETNSGIDKPFLDKGLLRVALQNNEQKGTIKKTAKQSLKEKPGI